jgi:hypothetical protein
MNWRGEAAVRRQYIGRTLSWTVPIWLNSSSAGQPVKTGKKTSRLRSAIAENRSFLRRFLVQPQPNAGGINRGIREIRGKQPSCRFPFRVFGVFRGFYCRGNCSQAANNLIYCRAEKRLLLEISAAIASLRFFRSWVLVAPSLFNPGQRTKPAGIRADGLKTDLPIRPTARAPLGITAAAGWRHRCQGPGTRLPYRPRRWSARSKSERRLTTDFTDHTDKPFLPFPVRAIRVIRGQRQPPCPRSALGEGLAGVTRAVTRACRTRARTLPWQA